MTQVQVQLPDQVQGVLTVERGGTSNDQGGAGATWEPWENASGSSIALGAVVRRISDGTWANVGIEAVDDETATDVLGIVGGKFSGNRVLPTAVADKATAYVVTTGVVYVLVGEAVSAGEYASPSTTAGKAQGLSTPNSATFGTFLDDGTSGTLVRTRITSKSARPTPAGVSQVKVEAGNLSDDVTTGLGAFQQVDYAGHVIGCSLTTDAAGSVEIDVLKNNESTPLMTGTNSIFGGDYPSTSSATYARMDPTSNWTTTVAIGDVFRLEIRSVTGSVTRVTAVVEVRQN